MTAAAWVTIVATLLAAPGLVWAAWQLPPFDAARKSRALTRQRNEDWYGAPERLDRDGITVIESGRPSLLGRIERMADQLEVISAELMTNGGSSIKDQLNRVETRLISTETKVADHATESAATHDLMWLAVRGGTPPTTPPKGETP